MMNAFCRVTVISMAVEAIAIQPSSPMNNLLMRDFSCLLFCPFIMSTGLYLAMAIDDAVPEGIAINNAVKINMIYSPEVRIGCTSTAEYILAGNCCKDGHNHGNCNNEQCFKGTSDHDPVSVGAEKLAGSHLLYPEMRICDSQQYVIQ